MLIAKVGTNVLGQARDAVALQTAVQGRAGQVRDGRSERIEAVIQGQQAVLAENHNDSLLFHGQHT